MVEFSAVTRAKSKARIALIGPSGAGKTLSALYLAYGITGDWSKIALIDTEHERGRFYAERSDLDTGAFLYAPLTPPYTVDRYIDYVQSAAKAVGVDGVLISTLSDEEKAEIEKRVDVEDVSKSQLEKAIADLKAENKRLEEEKQVTFDELEKLKNKSTDVSQAKDRINYLSDKLEEQKKLTEQESKQREDAARRASKAEYDRDSLKAHAAQLEDRIKELEARKPETETVTVTETVEIKDDIDEFRAHFTNALDSVARLISFVKQHEDSRNFDLFDKKLRALADKLNGGT